MAGKFKNILIIKPSALGDVVLGLPALSALRKGFPEARISWLVRPEFAALLEGHPYLDEVLYFDRKFLGTMLWDPAAFGEFWKLISHLRSRRFDLVVDLQGLLRTAVLGWLSGCGRRFSTADCREGAGLFYTDQVAIPDESPHVVDYYLKVAQATGAKSAEAEFLIPVQQRTQQQARQKIVKQGGNWENYAVFIIGSAHTDKCWPAERFARLGQMVARHYGCSLVLVGTKDQEKAVSQFRRLCPVEYVDLVGETSLAELAALMKNTRLAVSNDTGPAHIASAMAVPLVVIYGRANPARLYPYGRPECVAAIEPFERGSRRNDRNPKYDVSRVPLEMVWQKVQNQLNTG